MLSDFITYANMNAITFKNGSSFMVYFIGVVTNRALSSVCSPKVPSIIYQVNKPLIVYPIL